MNKLNALCISMAMACASSYTLAQETNQETKVTPAQDQVQQTQDQVQKQEQEKAPVQVKDSTKQEIPISSDNQSPHKPLKDIAPFPEPVENQSRYVIFLEPKDNEDNYKVEIVSGKTLEVDCNRVMLGGTATEQTLQGWGYNYFTIEQIGKPAMTLMACQDQKKELKFITATSTMVNYNSKLPIVVYAPSDIDVKYRIWSAPDDYLFAGQE